MAISLTAVLVMAGAVAVGAVVKGLSRLETVGSRVTRQSGRHGSLSFEAKYHPA
jgi:hypothetical protein